MKIHRDSRLLVVLLGAMINAGMGVFAMLAHLGLVRRIPPEERQRVHS